MIIVLALAGFSALLVRRGMTLNVGAPEVDFSAPAPSAQGQKKRVTSVTIEDIPTPDFTTGGDVGRVRYMPKMLAPSQRLYDFIKSKEGFSATPFDDYGKLTIGYGHRGDDVKPGMVWTREHAERVLREDVEAKAEAVRRYIVAPLSQGEFDALVSFTYNLGAGNLQNSTLRRKLNDGDYKGAAEEFSRWVYAGGEVLAGLVERREAEKQIFLA